MQPKYLFSPQKTNERGRTCLTFEAKPASVKQLINEALHILDIFGVPIANKTPRRLERMALSFLALCDVNVEVNWRDAKSLATGYALKTRDIINYLNQHFNENISRGSYDDIRRKDLQHPVLAGIIVSNRPNTARNNPARAWAINDDFINIIRTYGKANWEQNANKQLAGKQLLRERLEPKRTITKIPVKLPSGTTLEFGPGKHNQLQKAIIEEFLPRYGYGADVIYVGDAEDKFLHYEKTAAKRIGLLELEHEELPDIVAFSEQKHWLYLIEAVHSSGPVSAERIIMLQPFIESCTAPVIYVTAFLDRKTFRKFIANIAWETEVWIVDEPDHVIHFDGDKFLGPYDSGMP